MISCFFASRGCFKHFLRLQALLDLYKSIKQRQRERQTKKTEKERGDRTGQDRTGQETDGNLKRVMVSNHTCLSLISNHFDMQSLYGNHIVIVTPCRLSALVLNFLPL